jgi:hypothetical protein
MTTTTRNKHLSGKKKGRFHGLHSEILGSLLMCAGIYPTGHLDLVPSWCTFDHIPFLLVGTKAEVLRTKALKAATKSDRRNIMMGKV